MLITNRKSHVVFQLVLTSVLEARRYFTEFDSFGGRLRQSGWRETYDVCRISSTTFGQNWPTLQRGLSAIAELLVFCTCRYLLLHCRFTMGNCQCTNMPCRPVRHHTVKSLCIWWQIWWRWECWACAYWYVASRLCGLDCTTEAAMSGRTLRLRLSASTQVRCS